MEPTAHDRIRQIVVAVGAVVAIAGSAWGAGAFGGTPIEEAADGALAADATLVAPASGAFAIWSVVYAGLVLFAIIQLLPSRAASERYRAVSWWVLASMVLNAAWIATIQAGAVWVSVGVMIALAVVLVIIARRLASLPAGSWVDSAATDVTCGIYLGWVLVALTANVAAALRASTGATADAGLSLAIAACVLTAVVAVVIARAWRSHPPLVVSVGLAMAWGLAWIAVGRMEAPESLPMVWAAGLAAIVAFAAPFAAIDFDPARRIPTGRR